MERLIFQERIKELIALPIHKTKLGEEKIHSRKADQEVSRWY